MNADWSNRLKEIQVLLKKEGTFHLGIEKLLDLRLILLKEITGMVNSVPSSYFYEMPFKTAKGYHNKTLVYSMWHMFRIEDIVMHTLIANDDQILFTNDHFKKTNSPIITTGNELVGDEIYNFSKQLNVYEVLKYGQDVIEKTNIFLHKISYKDLKRTFSVTDKNRLVESKSVSRDDKAFWLIDYWSNKNVLGLILMPFSRHYIMHVEAMLRIKNKWR